MNYYKLVHYPFFTFLRAWVVLILCLFLFSCGSNKEDPAPTFSPVGQWVGVNWYCNNTTACVINQEDALAEFRFTITEINGNFKVSDGIWNRPSCQPPSCGVMPWVADSVLYSKGSLYIHWEHGYEFKGTWIEDKFQGIIFQVQSVPSIIWNDKIQIRKQ